MFVDGELSQSPDRPNPPHSTTTSSYSTPAATFSSEMQSTHHRPWRTRVLLAFKRLWQWLSSCKPDFEHAAQINKIWEDAWIIKMQSEMRIIRVVPILYLAAIFAWVNILCGNLEGTPTRPNMYLFIFDLSNLAPVHTASGALWHSSAQSIGLPDFIIPSLFGYCTANLPSGDVTECVDSQISFWFNPIGIIEDRLVADAVLDVPILATLNAILRGTWKYMNACLIAAGILTAICFVSSIAAMPVSVSLSRGSGQNKKFLIWTHDHKASKVRPFFGWVVTIFGALAWIAALFGFLMAFLLAMVYWVVGKIARFQTVGIRVVIGYGLLVLMFISFAVLAAAWACHMEIVCPCACASRSRVRACLRTANRRESQGKGAGGQSVNEEHLEGGEWKGHDEDALTETGVPLPDNIHSQTKYSSADYDLPSVGYGSHNVDHDTSKHAFGSQPPP